MFIQTILRWLYLYRNNDNLKPNDAFEVFVISGGYTKDKLPGILKKYFLHLDISKKVKDFTFRELLFGSLRFAGHPPRKNLNRIDKIKRILIRCFHVNYEKKAEIWNLVDTIFLPSDGRNIYLPGQHVIDIYQAHLPEYKVSELKSYFSPYCNFLIYVLALFSSKRFQDTKGGICVFANMISPSLLKAYKLVHPKKDIVVRFHDHIAFVRETPVKVRKILEDLIEKKIIMAAESYSESDAKLLNITYRPNAVNPDTLKRVDYDFRDHLYTFIGAYKSIEDKSRLNDLDEIRNRLRAVFKGSSEYINEYMVNVNNFDNERISYDEYLEIIGKSEIIVDMYRIDPYEGFSFRIPEALMLNRKVITNRLVILKYDFYDPSRFFIIGYDSIERLEEFVKGHFKPLLKETADDYDCRNWWKL